MSTGKLSIRVGATMPTTHLHAALMRREVDGDTVMNRISACKPGSETCSSVCRLLRCLDLNGHRRLGDLRDRFCHVVELFPRSSQQACQRTPKPCGPHVPMHCCLEARIEEESASSEDLVSSDRDAHVVQAEARCRTVRVDTDALAHSHDQAADVRVIASNGRLDQW